MKQKFSKKNSRKPVNIFAVLKPYKWLIGLLVLLTISANGLSLWVPKIIALGIDEFNSGSLNVPNLLMKFAGISVFILIFSYLQSLLQTFISEKAAMNLRSELIKKISGQSFSYIQNTGPSKLLTNLTSDVDAIKMFVAQAVASLIASVFLIIGASTLLIITNWQLALTVLAILPLIGISFFLVMGRLRPLFKDIQGVIDKLNLVINESILGAPLIRVLNSQNKEEEKFKDVNTLAKNNGFKILNYFAILIPIITFISGLATLIILAQGGHLVIIGKMTLGELTAFNSYVGILIFPIIMIGFMSNVISRSTASYERILEVLSRPDEKEDGNIKTKLKGNIEFDNVSLSYGQKQVLKNVSFKIKAGSKNAIIGPTASGKSQLLYLLSGLMKPEKGEVKYDGILIDKYDQHSLHQQIGTVFQDSIIFNMSLKENISFSKTVDDAELEKAIKTAELKDFIDKLPQKLETKVSERGSNLSGGQKQRIMLSRALALNPSILLLDDFTARVDSQTEQKIISHIEKEYPDITLVSITQKIGSIKNYDQIILLMEGEIIACGTHKELLKSCPEYVQLFKSQRSTSHYELSTQ
jgi:ATP-binding cassette subfamily B protein